MKKLFLVLSIVSYCFTGHAQQVTKEQAISICAQEMAAFTKAVSGFYKKGMSYDQFQTTLCGKLQPTAEGGNQLKVAYNFLTQGASNDFIIKNYRGREVADVMNYLQNAHKKGVESDGSELFGGKTGTSNSGLAKNANGCHWYQFWCLVQEFANWVVANWPTISQIITFIMTLFP
ncbi:MAG: hypothetical protein QM737_13980 [Ferruginibacter sp.]